MPADIGVFKLRGNHRSQMLAEAVADGLRRLNERVFVYADNQYRKVEHAVAAFYGYDKSHPQIMADYVGQGRKVVFLDLGYWGRREGGRWSGYHKVAVNDRHPTDVFQLRKHDDSRLRRFLLKPRKWRKAGNHILVAGMSEKSAHTYGFQAEEWERWAIGEIRKHTDRPIHYRPKPSWRGASRLPGARFSPPSESLPSLLRDCHAVVTHHSNVAIDGLVEGIPAFCWDGVAKPMALQDLSRIETPVFPDGREQWMADISWFNWSVDEIRRGKMWRFLKDEGLVP